MKSKVLTVLTPFLLGAFLVGQAGASIITFDDVGDKVTISSQYSGVTFSTTGLNEVVLTTSQNPPYTGTVPNLICTGQAMPIGTVDCSHDLILDFAKPVDNLKFDAFGNQSAVGTSFAQADIYQNGGLLPTTSNLPLLVSHTSHTASCPGDPASPTFTPDCLPDPLDFSAYAGITKLVIHSNTDTQGTAYDNFSFNAAETTDPTPEPSSLYLAGIGGLIWAGSRRLLARKSL